MQRIDKSLIASTTALTIAILIVANISHMSTTTILVLAIFSILLIIVGMLLLRNTDHIDDDY